MYTQENEEVSKTIKWARKNTIIWDLICGEEWCDFTVEDYIDMLKKLHTEEMYQLALVLIYKMDMDNHLREAISNVIVNRINKPKNETGIITEYIEEIKKMAIEKDIMKKTITLP